MVLITNSINDTLCRCAVCGSEDIRHWFDTEFGSIGRCGHCSQVLRADKPQYNSQLTLHQTSNLHDTSYALRSEQASNEIPFYESFLDLCEKKAACGKILDVGCGAGEFLKLAADRGFDVAGVEPVPELRSVAETRLGNKSIESESIEKVEFEAESSDAIMASDVLEHLIDPRGTLAKLSRLLKSGGYLSVATINHDNLMYMIYHLLRWTCPPVAKRFGPILYNPFHTYYFTKQSLARLVRNTGFEIVEHRGYEFPIRRLDVGRLLKVGIRGVYFLQGVLGMQGEQYVFARKG